MKKKVPYIVIGLIIILTTILIIFINKKNKLNLDEQMTNYCLKIYKDTDIGDKEIYISLKSMKERYDFDISEFEKKEHNCSLENSMARVYKKNNNIVCSINLICESK